MALEKLQSVFNNISDNTQNLEDGYPVESISNSLYDDFHSFGTQGNRTELIEVTKISKNQNPSPLMAINGIFAEDGTRIPVNPDVNGHNFRQIRINDNAGTNLLKTVGTEYSGNKGFGQVVINKNNEVKDFISPYNLGKGKFILESLFDKTHGNSTPGREPFGEPGRLSSDLLLHTPEGIGSTKYLNIRNNEGSYGGRFGNFSKVNEPYIVHPIGFSSPNERKKGYDRDGIPLRAAGEDVSRLLNYYLSADGIQFMLKENVTNIAVGDGFTPSNIFRSLMLPPLPVPTTGFLNGYQQRMQANFPTIPEFEVFGKAFNGFEGRSGRSNRKPLARNYSEEFTSIIHRPFRAAVQGDVDSLLNGTFTNPIKQTEFQENKAHKIKFRFDTNENSAQDAFNAGASNTQVKGLLALDATTNAAGKVGNVVLVGGAQKTLDGLNAIKEAARKAAHVAKEAARKKIQEVIDVGVALPKQPLKDFSGLNRSGPGGKYKVIDNLSMIPPLDPADAVDVEDNIDPGDFYVRIQDLRKMTDGTAGKVLYFRGFVTGITENITPSWNPTTYIGRSEDVWIYQKAERDLSFNLRVAPANKLEHEYMYQKMEKLTSLAYPSYLPDGGMVRMQPPLTALYMAHIGSKSVGQFGYIKSLTYTVSEQGDWDALSQLPRVFDIALSYQILNKEAPNMVSTKFYSPIANDVSV